jgi:regulator of protease activity HflC (stomatin/prohibitin superfamily)
MKMKTAVLGKQVVMTKDNIQLTVDTIVYYRVVNPLRVKYGLGTGAISHGIK